MIPGLTLERADFAELREEWTSLGARARGIFATWEWAAAWWRHHGRGEEDLLLHACRGASGELLAVIPLYLWRRRPLKILRFVGHGPSDELGPIFDPLHGASASAGLRAVLGELDFDVFLGELLPPGHEWAEVLASRAWRREPSPRMTLPEGGWPAYLQARSPGFRQQLGRRRRELERLGAQFRLADPSTLDDDLDTLFALHRARWGGPSAFSDSGFQRELNRSAQARGWLRLWLLEVGGRPVAAWHGFNVEGVVSYYQAGRDPAYDRLSAGVALMAHSIEQSCREGASEYRFGRGAESFKFRFGGTDSALEAVVSARGILGRVGLDGARAARAIRNGLRRGARLAQGRSRSA